MGINSAIRTLEDFLHEAKQERARRVPPSAVAAARASAEFRPPSREGRRNESLLDARSAATFLNLSVSWVYKAAERGDLPCLRIGAALRFEQEALRVWVRDQAKKPRKLRSV